MPSPALWAAPTFLFVGGLSLGRPAAPRQAEGALPGEAGAAGVEGSCDSAFLLPPLFPLQTGCKGTAHGVAQPLTLWEGVGVLRDCMVCRPDPSSPGFQQPGFCCISPDKSLTSPGLSSHLHHEGKTIASGEKARNRRAILYGSIYMKFSNWRK